MAKLSDIKLGEMLKLKPTFWKKLAVKVRSLIKEDMIKGEAQGYSGGGAMSYSRQYAKYKRNDMRRFTDGKRLGSQMTITRKTARTKGQRLALQFKQKGDKITQDYKNNNLQGKQLNNQTSTVNMFLTGDLINGLKYVTSNFFGMIMSYNTKDQKKIEGNELRGRYVRTLNSQNQDQVLTDIRLEIEKNIKTKLPKEIVINLQVGL